MVEIINYFSKLVIPLFILFVVLYGYKSKVKLYESFVSGAKEGFEISLRVLPYIVAILIAVKGFQASGAFDLLKKGFSSLFTFLNIPAEIFGIALLKPLSNSAAVGVFVDILKTSGADSLVAKISAVILGSAETTFYVLAVYLGSVGIKKSKYLVPVCIISDLIGIIIAIFVVKILL
ncbi:MAG TPA: spore maturation protein [Elusimicrobia bacterium]|nr:spore maturation protein [Elusimicrobiota bacterium]